MVERFFDPGEVSGFPWTLISLLGNSVFLMS